MLSLFSKGVVEKCHLSSFQRVMTTFLHALHEHFREGCREIRRCDPSDRPYFVASAYFLGKWGNDTSRPLTGQFAMILRVFREGF